MRSFLAIDFPDFLKRLYAEALRGFREQFPSPRWVRPECLHMTLRFLGEVEDEGARALEEPVRELAAGFAPFELAIGEPGYFGPSGAPRVYWFALMKGEDPLGRVQAGVEEIVREAGYPPEDRPWTPHITVARSARRKPRPGSRVATAEAWLEAARKSALSGARIPVKDLTLMTSELTPEGPVYTSLWSADLGARDRGRVPAEQ